MVIPLNALLRGWQRPKDALLAPQRPDRMTMLQRIARPLQSINLYPLFLLLASLLTAALLAMVQCILVWQSNWNQASLYIPSLLVFLLPTILIFGGIALANHWWLSGAERVSARRAAWTALAARLACLMLIPLGMTYLGYQADVAREGVMSADALNAAHSAWTNANAALPISTIWTRASGDNTGGITVIAVILYRLLSMDMARPLLLGLAAAFFSTFSVAATYRFGELVFPRKIAVIAAWIVALYPEAVMIGSSHLQTGYLAAWFGILMFGLAGLFIRRSPEGELADLPSPWVCLLIAIFAMAGTFFISTQFFQLLLFVVPISLVWFVDARSKISRWIWIAGGALLGGVLLLFVLNQLNLISSHWDFITIEGKYLFGAAWTEFDKAAASNGQDMFQGAIASLPRAYAFVVAGFYGILQPVLPASIGFRNTTDTGGAFWQILGIWRGLGWYPMLLFVFYAGLSAFGGIRPRHPETLMALFFWVIAYAGSYRAMGDQWDNPRYRLFVLIPMALLAAWGWYRFRQKNDMWFYRLLWPFAFGVSGLTIWYILRYYFAVKFPPVQSLAVLVVLSFGVFFLMLLYSFVRRKKRAA
jgi:hypothetical protein